MGELFERLTKKWKWLDRTKDVFFNPRWIVMAAFAWAILSFAKALRPALASVIETVPAGSAYDIVLAALPVIGDKWLLFIYVYGVTAALILFYVTKLYYKPIDFPYAILLLSSAMILTDILFTVTVLGPPANYINSWLAFDFNKDLFPSMHIGSPFIAFLLSDRKWVKRIMLGVTLAMVVIVLLMHTHYTIDVIGAIFIFYGVYCLYEKYLKKFLRRAYFNKV